MKLRTNLIAMLAAIVTVLALTGSLQAEEKKKSPLAGKKPKMWFPVGETSIYRLYWGIIPVGWAELASSWVEEDGKLAISLRMSAKTGKLLSAIYPVDDNIESIVDPYTFLPIRYTQKLREGKRTENEETKFDHAAGVAHWESYKSGKTNDIPVSTNTRDIVSFSYFMRSKGYQVGKVEQFRVLVDEKIYDLTITGLNKDFVYLSKFGDVPCLELKPEAKFGEIFVRKGSVNMWFSEDSRRLCTKMVGVVPVANVKAILRKVEGPGSDFWIDRKKLKTLRKQWKKDKRAWKKQQKRNRKK